MERIRRTMLKGNGRAAVLLNHDNQPPLEPPLEPLLVPALEALLEPLLVPALGPAPEPPSERAQARGIGGILLLRGLVAGPLDCVFTPSVAAFTRAAIASISRV
jgi:hypothetical protein